LISWFCRGMNENQKVIYVRFSRRTRGMSTCCSFISIPLLAFLILWVLKTGSMLLWLYLGPDRWQLPIFDLTANLVIVFLSVLLSIILVVLFLTPKKVDRFIDWWFGL
jgi:hypothetical protein